MSKPANSAAAEAAAAVAVSLKDSQPRERKNLSRHRRTPADRKPVAAPFPSVRFIAFEKVEMEAIY